MITPVTVRVPATVANLGPGFDTLGLAIEWRNEIRIEPAPSLEVIIQGEGAGAIDTGADNLVVRAMERMLGAVPRARIVIANAVPVGRGLGSSAGAIAGGLLAAASAGGNPSSPTDLLPAAIEMEGHADNVSACLLGGVTVSLAGAPTARLEPPEGIRLVLAVAPGALATLAARAALPAMVPFGDAAVTVARCARLVAALATADPSVLLAATEDTLHQPARFALTPESGALVHRLRAAGFGAFLSGAGPSVAALVAAAAAPEAVAAARRFAGDGWHVRDAELAATGAEVVVDG